MVDWAQIGVIFTVIAIVIILIIWLTVRCLRKGKPCPCKGRIDGKVVVVTGGDSPEGICLIRELCKRGAERVIMAVTDVGLGQDVAVDVRGETNGEVVVEYCDMASIKSVRNFCTKIPWPNPDGIGIPAILWILVSSARGWGGT